VSRAVRATRRADGPEQAAQLVELAQLKEWSGDSLVWASRARFFGPRIDRVVFAHETIRVLGMVERTAKEYAKQWH
jgi:hypothetical protein